jgi:hypothetical protein
MSFSSEFITEENKSSFEFESYGVRIGVNAKFRRFAEVLKKKLEAALPENFRVIENRKTDHLFEVDLTAQNVLKLFQNGEEITEGGTESVFFKFMVSRIRLTVAEHAVSKVFIHAGTVGWNEKALILPASSFHGKTTLVRELVKRGATYFSDEYAVLDGNGLVHPFPKTLSVRGIRSKYEQVELSAESFGGVVAKNPLPVGMVLMTEFKPNAIWEPLHLTTGEGILEMVAHTLPIRLKPKYTLQVLNVVAERAIICKSFRGDAQESAGQILEYFDLNT